MKLVVGLGNPGAKYRETRHNVGFLVVDELARRSGLGVDRELFGALVARAYGAVPVLFAKPLTFMNLSGQSVQELAHFHKVDAADVLVVADDVNLPLGRLRARRGGSAGGHNGLKSIAQSLGTDQFPRLRVGVGGGEPGRDLSSHVLGRFESDERDQIAEAVVRAADAVDVFLTEGIEQVMNRFNADNAKADEELPDESGSA